MENKYETYQISIINEFTKTIEMFGLTTLEARLFVYLYLEDRPQTLDEMSAALGKSKTSMSTSIRKLADLNLVSQVWRKGVRKDLYKANGQVFNQLVQSYMQKWNDLAVRQKEALEDIKQQLKKQDVDPSEDDKDRAQLLNRLDEIIHFHNKLQNLYKVK